MGDIGDIHTGGGAANFGTINVESGDFIGRDLIQTTNNFNYVIQQLSPKEKAKLEQDALALFNTLPTDKIVEKHRLALPEGSRLPFDINPHFVGRQAELLQLARTLKGNDELATIGQSATVVGYGGIGKSQLAIEFAQRYGPFFAGGVFFLNFEQAANIEGEIALCAQDLRLPGLDHLSLAEQVNNVIRRWKDPIPKLVICDNCEDPELIDQWVVQKGLKLSGARFIITSRMDSNSWKRSKNIQTSPIELNTLTRSESKALLIDLVEELSDGGHQITDGDADRIAERLGDFPLALHLAGSYIGVYEVSADQYLEEWTIQHDSMQGRGVDALPNRHMANVEETFALSWEKLIQSEFGELDTKLLTHAVYFAPGEPIQREWLFNSLGEDEETSQADRIDSLNRLSRVGLIRRDCQKKVVTTHRLVCEYVRLTSQTVEALQEISEKMAEFIDAEVGRQIDQGFPLRVIPFQPHLRHQIELSEEKEPVRQASLLNWLAYHLDDLADYTEARPLYERALAIREAQLGPNHPDTATSLNNLAYLVQSQGNYGEARPLFERALAIREAQLGPDHPHTATSLNDLAHLLYAQGNYGEARPLFERALAIYEALLGPDHPHTATSLGNLALLLKAQGNTGEARPLYERALAIREAQLGPDHPDTANSLNNLAALLESQGNTAEARPLFERALAILESTLGKDHPTTEIVRNNLDSMF